MTNVLLFPAMNAEARPSPPMTNRLREWRVARGMTLEQLGKKIGLTKGHLSKMELGQRELTLAWMERIATELGVDPADLLNLDSGGLSPAERRIIATYREVPAALRASLDAVTEGQQPYRGQGEVAPFGTRKSA